MSRGIRDWQSLGVFPLQDHDIDGVPLGKREQLVGCRLSFVPDAERSTDPSLSMYEYALDGGKGTLGDIHPWWFWQTRDRDERDTGAWSMAFAAVITGTSGGFSNGPTGTGTAPAAQFLPIRNSTYLPDSRFVEKSATLAPGVPTPPIGSVCIAMPATEESSQQELLICSSGPGGGGGALLIAPTKRGPPEMGTLVWDLQPKGTLCKDGSPIPGIGGRHARLQSAFRVIPMDGAAAIGAGAGNSIAINYSLSTQDSLAGFGMTWTRLAGGGTQAAPAEPPAIGPPRPPGGAVPIGPPLPPGAPGGPIGPPVAAPIGPPVPPGALGGKGQFKPEKVGGHGIAYMAHLGAFGPFHGGSENDIHRIGFTRDGEPCNSGHLSTDAYFYADAGHDGPLFFEADRYPDPPPQPITTKVHMAWDATLPHPWLRGAKAGRWRWYAETAAICPESETPTVPQTRVPVTGGPGRGGPTTPRIPGPGEPGSGGPTVPGTRQPTTPGGGGPGRPTTPGSRQPSAPGTRVGPGGRIWTGAPVQRPGGGGGTQVPGSRQPTVGSNQPQTPGNEQPPTQGVPWEHLTVHNRPLPRIEPDPGFGGSVQPHRPITGSRVPIQTSPSRGRGANFGGEEMEE